MIKGKREIKKKYKEYENEIYIEYDSNNDGLITLDEYLSKEISKGPKAKPSTIDYYYREYDNVYNYFMVVFLKIKKFKIMCVPNFVLKYKDIYEVRTAIAYNIQTKELYYSKDIKSSLIKCAKKDNVRFIFFSFVIINKKSNSSHANIVIIDLLKSTYERFEPYGRNMYDGRFTKTLDNLFENKVRSILEMNNFEYISPAEISPLFGIQSVADSYCGMCVTISMMYLHMRILNPNLSQKKVLNFLLKRDKKKLKEMILKYAKHVEETLKKNKIVVSKLIKDTKKKLKKDSLVTNKIN
jgi:hypothetical protein